MTTSTTRATTKKKRDSRPAPDAGWPMLPDRRPRKLRPVEPEPAADLAIAQQQGRAPDPASEDVVAVLVEIAFTLDGQPTGVVAKMQMVMPRLPADQDAMHLRIGLDARQTMQAIEPHVGPSRASTIVTPGSPGFQLPGRS